MTDFKLKIAHPDWLEHSEPGKYLSLYRSGNMPASISGWMLVVSLKHPLRAIYGSDFRAAVALLGYALHDIFDSRIWSPLLRVAYNVPFFLAWVWTHLQTPFMRYPLWSRRDSPEPVRCDDCGWAGMRRWAIHGYTDDGSGQDVEPTDECPRCGNEV